MLWLLLLCFPLWGLELAVVPIFIWMAGSPRWHPYLIAWGVLLAAILCVFASRRIAGDFAHDPASKPMRNRCAWTPGLTPEEFGTQLALFLRMRGWRIAAAGVGPTGRLELAAAKDRWSVALLCIPQQDAGGPPDVERLAAFARERNAQQAGIVTGRKLRGHALSRAARTITRLKYDDLSHLESAFGLD